MSYGRALYIFCSYHRESRFRVSRDSRALHNNHRVTFPASSTKGLNYVNIWAKISEYHQQKYVSGYSDLY